MEELSEAASEETGKILAMLKSKGEGIDFRDILIAAISKIQEMVLVRNTGHLKDSRPRSHRGAPVRVVLART